MKPLHESVAKEKLGEISLIEARNEANNELLASFPTKSSGISTIFTRHPTRAKVSDYLLLSVSSIFPSSLMSISSTFSSSLKLRQPLIIELTIDWRDIISSRIAT